MENIKILIISPYLPSRDTTGFARKVHDFIRLANQRGHLIYLLSFCSQADKKRVSLISPYCRQVNLEYLSDYRRYPGRSLYFEKTIRKLVETKVIDILQCENSYLRRYLPEGIDTPSVLVEHEVLSASFLERAGFEGNYIKQQILYARAAKKIREEKRWYKKFDRVIVFSQTDKQYLTNRYKLDNLAVVALGIDSGEYLPVPESAKTYDLIFTGNFSHAPNEDAVLYFCKEVLPLIKEKIPGVNFLVAGEAPSLAIKDLSRIDQQITVSGYVEDLKNLYAQSRVFIAPIRYGTGMRFKILEALALQNAVVTTSVGARGIEAKDIMRIADSKQEFAAAVIELLKDDRRQRELSARGRQAIRDYYDWGSLLDKYEDIYRTLLNN